MIFACGIIGSNHFCILVWGILPYHCLCYYMGGSAFCENYLAHSEMIHVSESVLCEEIPAIL